MSKSKLNVAMWAVVGVILAGLIFTGFYFELNVIDNGQTEVVVDGVEYVNGQNNNGGLGAATGIFGALFSAVWVGVGISWLYRRAK